MFENQKQLKMLRRECASFVHDVLQIKTNQATHLAMDATKISAIDCKEVGDMIGYVANEIVLTMLALATKMAVEDLEKTLSGPNRLSYRLAKETKSVEHPLSSIAMIGVGVAVSGNEWHAESKGTKTLTLDDCVIAMRHLIVDKFDITDQVIKSTLKFQKEIDSGADGVPFELREIHAEHVNAFTKTLAQDIREAMLSGTKHGDKNEAAMHKIMLESLCRVAEKDTLVLAGLLSIYLLDVAHGKISLDAQRKFADKWLDSWREKQANKEKDTESSDPELKLSSKFGKNFGMESFVNNLKKIYPGDSIQN